VIFTLPIWNLYLSTKYFSCGVPIYANTYRTTCRNCSSLHTLSINPHIIGTLLDETGCVGAGKLLWSERAWETLLGRCVEDVTMMTTNEIRLLEQRMMYMRVHLVVGWEESIGKLAVLGMRAWGDVTCYLWRFREIATVNWEEVARSCILCHKLHVIHSLLMMKSEYFLENKIENTHTIEMLSQ